MELKELAISLDGIEIDEFHSCSDTVSQAKAAGIVIVFGASDDLIEFRGAIDDEAGVGEEDTTLIDRQGVVPVYPDGSFRSDLPVNIEQCRELVGRFDQSIPVSSHWCPDDGSNASWAYSVPENIEWEPFNIMEDGEIYCVGIVFKLP